MTDYYNKAIEKNRKKSIEIPLFLRSFHRSIFKTLQNSLKIAIFALCAHTTIDTYQLYALF